MFFPLSCTGDQKIHFAVSCDSGYITTKTSDRLKSSDVNNSGEDVARDSFFEYLAIRLTVRYLFYSPQYLVLVFQ